MTKDHKDPKIQIPLKTLHGSKYLLSIINLALIGIVLILCGVSALLSFHAPAKDISNITSATDILDSDDEFINGNVIDLAFLKKQDKSSKDYSIITEKNIFSPEREEWVTIIKIPEPVEIMKKEFKKPKSPSRKPRKIILYGVIIAGDTKKALIKQPLNGSQQEKDPLC